MNKEIDISKRRLSRILTEGYLGEDVLNETLRMLAEKNGDQRKDLAIFIVDILKKRVYGIDGDPVGGTDSQTLIIKILIVCFECM